MNYSRASSPKEHGLPTSPPSTPIPFNQEIKTVKPVAWDWQSKPEMWAPAILQQLDAQLQQQPLEQGQSPAVEVLLAELQVLVSSVLKDGSPAAWYYLYNVLGSLSPYRILLGSYLDIIPFLEQLYNQAPQIQAELGLDFLEVLRQAFPPDTSMTAPSSHICCRHQKKLRSFISHSVSNLPCPFVQTEQRQRQEDEEDNKNWVYPVTLSELQYALGIVGVDIAQDEAFWMDGLGLLPLAVATDIPVKYVSRKEEKHHGSVARPYSLTVVPESLVKPEHYVFSPFGVLHVHPVEGSEMITLGVWHRHAMLWQQLQDIPFFKYYLLKKALTCWKKNVKLHMLAKRRAFLGKHLLFAIPHFGVCLLHINRLLQELHSVSWLPQETNRCYTLPELQRALAKMNRRALQVLRRCLRLCAAVLQLVHEDTYRMRQGLQERVESISEYSSAKGSMYRKWFRRQQLQQKLNRAEMWWQLLGRLACLVDYMTCQNLVSILEKELVTFVNCVLQSPRQVAFLTGKLIFGEDGTLVMVPTAEQMAQSLSRWLHAVVTSALEAMESTDIQTVVTVFRNSGANSEGNQIESRTDSTVAPIEEEDEEELPPAFLSLAFRAQPNEAVRIFCGPETEMVRSRQSDPTAGPLEVLGHRMRAQYAPTTIVQLQKDLDTNHGIQQALATQHVLLEDVLLEVNKFCQKHKWLKTIYQFLKNWDSQKLDSTQNWTVERYLRLFDKLDVWQGRVSEVPTVLLTEKLLLHLDCNCVQTDIVSQLVDVKKDILDHLNNERYTRNEEIMQDLSDFVQVLQNISADIQTIAKCSQKLSEANEKSSELEERIEYVRALNDLVRSQFGKLSLEDEGLEIALLDMWETFLFERLQATEFLLSKQGTLVPQLQEMIATALEELENLSVQAVTGPFMDPTQEPRGTERQLIHMERTYVSISSHLTELHHAYVILSGEQKPAPVPQGGTQPIVLQQRVWRLFCLISEQIGEWKCLAFTKFSTSFAWEKTDHWLTEAAKLSRLFVGANPVIQACMHLLEEFRSYLPVLSVLASPQLQGNGWQAIFRVMGVSGPENIELLTLGQLLSFPLLEYQDRINQVWMSENEYCQTQDTLRQLQRNWENRQLRLLNFILRVPYEAPTLDRHKLHSHSRAQVQHSEIVAKDSGTYILSDGSSLQDAIRESLQTLLKIMNSPFARDIQDQAQEWVTIFRGLHALMEVWVVFQQKWIFLNKVIYEMKISLPSSDLNKRFQVVDSQYRELMKVSVEDPLVLSLMVPSNSRNFRFQDQLLLKLLETGNTELEYIIIALETVLYGVRSRFPRLFFLSNRELVALISAPLEGAEAQLWAHRCFPHVQGVLFKQCTLSLGTSALEAKEEAHSILGRYGEVLTLRAPLLLQHDIPKWLTCLEQWLRSALVHGLPECVAARQDLFQLLDRVFEQPPDSGQPPPYQHAHHWLELAQAFPGQCVLVAEEVVWWTQVEEALLNQRIHLLSLMQLRRLEALAHFARDQRNAQPGHSTFTPRLSLLLSLLLTGAVAHRDIALLLQQHQVSDFEDFHWARQFKYYLGPRTSSQQQNSSSNPPPASSSHRKKPSCWVEVLGQPHLYSYEYLGPGQGRVVHLLLERPALGLLLAVKEVACGTLLGPIGVGKSALVAKLASALGRHLVILPCVMHIEARCLGFYLTGALQSGAWLLLKAAGSLPAGLLSALGQRLYDLQHLYVPLLKKAPEIPEMDPMQPQVLGNSFFENHRVHVRFGYGCFLTFSHLSSTLPTNLRFLLRPVAIVLPDLQQLTEMTLVGAGLRDAVRLASRLATFFSLEQDLEPGLRPSRLPLLLQVLETTLQFLETPKDQPGPPLPRTLGATEEAALLHALLHSPLFSGPERPRLHMLRQLLCGIFPGAGNVFATPWTMTPPRLAEELRQLGLHVGPDFLSSLEQLNQALRQVPGILIMGPPGSGKSTCWQSLAKVQNQLISRGKTYRGIRPVDTTTIYPSSLSPEEFLGWFQEHCWNHGVFSQHLWTGISHRGKDSQGLQHWLVCDGVPSAAWLDPIASLLGNTAKLSLPNGQQMPQPPDTSFLLEVVNTAGMSPVVVGSCALVWCGGQQTWQAMLAMLMTALSQEYQLCPRTMGELHHLADSLVPTMLRFLHRQGINSVLHIHGQPTSSPGVAEITSMTHLLQGLLNPILYHKEEEQNYSSESISVSSSMIPDSEGIRGSISAEGLSQDTEGSRKYRKHILTINGFLLAFIWGFGSHLPSRFWSVYDNFVRGILKHQSNCPELPTSVSVFDLYLSPEDGSLVPFTGLYLSNRIKGALGNFNPSPQAERILYVTDLLLAAGHPVLLTGEACSGKSTFVEVLVEPNFPYSHIPIHLAFTTSHLRNLLSQEIQNQSLSWPGKLFTSRGSFLFLLEDLHLAAADPTRKCQPVLETLRQVLGHNTLYANHTLELQVVPTNFNWLAIATVPCSSELPLCPRFTRLFTVLLLGSVNRVTLLSRYCPGIQAWLERFPSLEKEELIARALVSATVDAWEAMQSHFPPSPCRPHYRFSPHTIGHLLNSLQFLPPRPHLRSSEPPKRLEQLRRLSGLRGTRLTVLVALRTIAHLWLHEAQRTFADRLNTVTEQECCIQMLLAVVTSAFSTSTTNSKFVWEPEKLKEVEVKEPVPEVESEGELSQWEDERSSSGSEDESAPETRDLLALTVTWAPVGPVPSYPSLTPWSEPPHEKISPSGIPVKMSHESISSLKPEKKNKMRWQKFSHLGTTAPLLLPALLLLPQERASELIFTQELTLVHSAEEPISYIEQTWDIVEKQLAMVLPEVRPGPRLSSCRPFAQHVARLVRVLGHPQQHGLLLSCTKGTGRRTALNLAVRLSQAQLFELPLAPEKAVVQCLKEASWHAAVLSQPAALMVREGASSFVVNLLIALLREGCFPGLYSEEEMETISEQLSVENTAVKIGPKKEAVLQRFRRLVCSNLHLFVLMSDSPRPFQIGTTTLLALLDLTVSSVDYYEPWNQSALISLAQSYLEGTFNRETEPDCTRIPGLQASVVNMAKVMALIHLSATKYCQLLCPLMPLSTPKTYLDFLDTFVLLHFHLSNRTQNKIQRIQTALGKLTKVIEQNNAHAQLVSRLQEELRKAHEVLVSCQEQLELDRTQYLQYLRECKQQETLICNLTKQRDALQTKQESLNEQMGQAFLGPLGQLQVTDMEELRSYRAPPTSVVMVTDGLCILFHRPLGWESAKQLLGKDDFFEDLVFFEKEKIKDTQLQRLNHILKAPAMNEKTLKNVSRAAAGLASWLRAVLCYGMTRRQGIATSTMLKHVESTLVLEQTRMGSCQMRAQELLEQNHTLTFQVEQARLSHNQLAEQLAKAIQGQEQKGQVKAALISPMNLWSTLTQKLKWNCHTVPGDALLSAAAINYLGPFPPQRRQEILNKWLALCAGRQDHLDPDDVALELDQEQEPLKHLDTQIPIRIPFSLLSVLSTETEQHQWDREMKPHAEPLRLVALLLRNPIHRFARRWPLIIDPNGQASFWLLTLSQQDNEDILALSQYLNSLRGGNTTQEDKEKKDKKEIKKDEEEDAEETEEDDTPPNHSIDAITFRILSASDPSLGRELSQAAAGGLSVLLCNVELGLWCHELQCLLQRDHLQLPGVHPNFCLYLSTKLPLDALAKGLNSDILKGMNIIDLSMIPEVIEEELLQEIIRAERPELESRWQSLELSILDAYDHVEDAQEKLLELVLNTDVDVLGRNYFLRDMLWYQAELYQRMAHLQELQEVEAQQTELRIHYQQVAHLGTTMSQAMFPLHRLHPLYPTALENCLTVTRYTLSSTYQHLSRQHGEDLGSHLQELGTRLVRHLLNDTMSFLQPRHTSLVGAFGALALLQISGQAPALERLALCPGLAASPKISKKVQDLHIPCPSWLGTKTWQECGLLELLPPFVGLRASLVAHSIAWQEYLRLPSTVVGQTPGPGTIPLSLLQKLVLWRVLRPDRLAVALADFTTCLLGRPLTEDQYPYNHPFRQSRPTRPLLVLLSPPGHPTTTTHPLPFIWKLASQQQQERLQVIGLGSSLWDSAHTVATTLNQAMRKGHWVVLDNCHLMSSWPSELLEPLLGLLDRAQVISEVSASLALHYSISGQSLIVHKKFRLWLISPANSLDSLPVVLVQRSIPIFWEQSLELGHMLINSLHERRQTQDAQKSSQENPKYTLSLNLSMPVMFLHSLLLNRQLYGSWLQAKCGNWSHTILDRVLETQEWIWKKFSNPWEALRELTGEIFYGGHVTDPEDQAAILSLVQACLDPNIELKPHSFSPQNLLAKLRPSPELSETEASLEVEAQAHLIPSLPEPRCCGLTEGPQAWLFRKQSQTLLANLHQSQDPWEPSGLPKARSQAFQQVEYRLKHRVSQAIRRLKALQAMLALSSRTQTRSWNSSRGLQSLEGFLEEEGTALGLLLPELHSDLSCLESQLAGGLPCSSPRCEEVATALWAGRLPPPWQHHMSAGPQPPWLWLRHLWHRGQLLSRYLSLCGQLGMGGLALQNRSFHLSAFRHPRGLLLAVRWEASQNWIYPTLSSTVMTGPGHQSQSGPGAQLQPNPSFISISQDSSPSSSDGPRSRNGPGHSISDGLQPILGHSLYNRFDFGQGFSIPTTPKLSLGFDPIASFNFGPNFSTGIVRQGIEAIDLCFQVECGPKPSAPEGGFLITGLLLHHAEWNPEDKAIQDGNSDKPSPLPPVSVSPQFINQDPPVLSTLPLYLCPVYLGGVLGSSRLDSAHVLLHLPLPTKLSPSTCVQRRVYVCSPPLI